MTLRAYFNISKYFYLKTYVRKYQVGIQTWAPWLTGIYIRFTVYQGAKVCRYLILKKRRVPVFSRSGVLLDVGIFSRHHMFWRKAGMFYKHLKLGHVWKIDRVNKSCDEITKSNASSGRQKKKICFKSFSFSPVPSCCYDFFFAENNLTIGNYSQIVVAFSMLILQFV